jgi:DNA-binding transcriptional LysR family regulator
VLDDRMLLALPQNHPLAAAENLQPAQLADQQWILRGGRLAIQRDMHVRARRSQGAQRGRKHAGVHGVFDITDSLGLMLFERNQQRIRLTADGQTFLAETRSLLTHAKVLQLA